MPSRSVPSTMRILTLNCWNVSAPFEERMSLIRAGIAELAPDLVGLQEIIVRRDGFDQGEMLLGGLGYDLAYGPASRWNDAGELLPWDAEGDAIGNLIASRWPIRQWAVHELPGAETGERRSAVAGRIETPAGELAFVTTNLNWKLHHGAVRERQAVELAGFTRAWARATRLPPVVVGDLNAEPDSAEVRFLCGLQSLEGRSTYFQDAWRVAGDGTPGFTWDNRNRFAAYVFEPSRRIDYVLVGLPTSSGVGSIESVRLALNEPHDSIFPSDHFGVLATIRC